MIRYMKIMLVAFVGLNGLLYFANNLMNWDAARGFVSAVISMADRSWYANALIPPLEGAAAATLALVLIVSGELLVGVLSLKGAADMLARARADADAFNASKKFAIMGCAMALIVWFGGFTVIGGALFQMWQHDLGQGSLGDALKYIAGSGFVLMWLTVKDD